MQVHKGRGESLSTLIIRRQRNENLLGFYQAIAGQGMPPTYLILSSPDCRLVKGREVSAYMARRTMMVDFEERKKVVYIELEPGTHRQLQDLASSLGIRISEAGGMCVERDLVRRVEMNPKSLESRLFLEVQRAKHRQEIRMQLRRVAWQNLQEENEEAMDNLALLCDEAGVSTGIIIDEARRHDTPPMVYDGGKLAEAIEFLHEIGHAVKELPTTEVMSTGADRDLSSSILKQAKKSLGITSKRRSLHWAWVWPETNRTN